MAEELKTSSSVEYRMSSGLNSESRQIGTYLNFAFDSVIIPGNGVIAKRQSVTLHIV